MFFQSNNYYFTSYHFNNSFAGEDKIAEEDIGNLVGEDMLVEEDNSVVEDNSVEEE